MSAVNYAAGLSEYDDLGVCGLDEVFDKPDAVKVKVRLLADWLRQLKGSCVVHVGAGLSTSAGIRDFRGKRGVWTELLQSRQLAEQVSRSSVSSKATKRSVPTDVKKEEAATNVGKTLIKPFDETVPTYGHLALKVLCELGFVRHIVSQNVDGLFLKANLRRKFISELHGNFYLDECTKCRSRFIRATSSPTMRLERSNIKCPRGDLFCKGNLRDTILDWETPIPYNELRVATRESKLSKLHICIGTSLQLKPSKDLVCKPKKKASKLVIINLQPTKFDQRADLVINYFADDVMKELTRVLTIEVADYEPSQDPTKDSNRIGTIWNKKM